MQPNPEAFEGIMEAVENQLRENDPPETAETLARLTQLGYSEMDAKKMIAQCIVVQIFNTIKRNMPSDNDAFVALLKALPEEPFDD